MLSRLTRRLGNCSYGFTTLSYNHNYEDEYDPTHLIPTGESRLDLDDDHPYWIAHDKALEEQKLHRAESRREDVLRALSELNSRADAFLENYKVFNTTRPLNIGDPNQLLSDNLESLASQATRDRDRMIEHLNDLTGVLELLKENKQYSEFSKSIQELLLKLFKITKLVRLIVSVCTRFDAEYYELSSGHYYFTYFTKELGNYI